MRFGIPPRMTASENQPQATIPQSQWDCGTKPRGARDELPWVTRPGSSQPQRGCGSRIATCRNPVGVENDVGDRPRVARPSQPWALSRNPFGILRKNFRDALALAPMIRGACLLLPSLALA